MPRLLKLCKNKSQKTVVLLRSGILSEVVKEADNEGRTYQTLEPKVITIDREVIF